MFPVRIRGGRSQVAVRPCQRSYWGASYAIDGYFWDRYLHRLITLQSRAALDAAVADLREMMPGAHIVGCFDVFVRDRAGGVKSLLSA